MASKSANRYSPELRERAVRMLIEQQESYPSLAAVMLDSRLPNANGNELTLEAGSIDNQDGFIASSDNHATAWRATG